LTSLENHIFFCCPQLQFMFVLTIRKSVFWQQSTPQLELVGHVRCAIHMAPRCTWHSVWPSIWGIILNVLLSIYWDYLGSSSGAPTNLHIRWQGPRTWASNKTNAFIYNSLNAPRMEQSSIDYLRPQLDHSWCKLDWLQALSSVFGFCVCFLGPAYWISKLTLWFM